MAPDVVVSDFMTRMLTMPAFAICPADIVAVNWVFETTFVGCAVPSHKICVPLVKFDPVAVNVKSALPAATEAGEIEVRVGVTTPLNPPHPATTVMRTSKAKQTLTLNTLTFQARILNSAFPERLLS